MKKLILILLSVAAALTGSIGCAATDAKYTYVLKNDSKLAGDWVVLTFHYSSPSTNDRESIELTPGQEVTITRSRKPISITTYAHVDSESCKPGVNTFPLATKFYITTERPERPMICTVKEFKPIGPL